MADTCPHAYTHRHAHTKSHLHTDPHTHIHAHAQKPRDTLGACIDIHTHRHFSTCTDVDAQVPTHHRVACIPGWPCRPCWSFPEGGLRWLLQDRAGTPGPPRARSCAGKWAVLWAPEQPLACSMAGMGHPEACLLTPAQSCLTAGAKACSPRALLRALVLLRPLLPPLSSPHTEQTVEGEPGHGADQEVGPRASAGWDCGPGTCPSACLRAFAPAAPTAKPLSPELHGAACAVSQAPLGSAPVQRLTVMVAPKSPHHASTASGIILPT